MDLDIVIQGIYLLFTMMILFSSYHDNKSDNHANQLMNKIFICVMLKISFTIGTLILSQLKILSLLNLMCIIGEFSIAVPLVIFYLDYIKEIVCIKEIIPSRLIVVIKIYCCCTLVLDIISLFGYVVFTTMLVLVFVLIYILLIKCKKGLSKREFCFLKIYMLAPFLGVFLQMLIHTRFDFINLGTMLGIMTMYMTIHMDRGREIALQEKEMISNEVAIMMSQIQPDFLYNALNNIYYIDNQNPKQLQKSIGDFAEYMRYNLDSIRCKQLVYFEKELSHIRTFLYFKNAQNDNQIQVSYNIETTEFRVPILSVQAIVENSINRELRQKNNEVILIINTKEYKDHFEIIIIDNSTRLEIKDTEADINECIEVENVRHRLYDMVGANIFIESNTERERVVTIRIPKGD